MNNFLFDHENMHKYWNCDIRTYEEWTDLAKPNMKIGLLYLCFGLVYLSISIPCMLALLRSDLMKYSAYKFMALIGIIDFFGLLNATFYFSYASMIGMVYCMAPTLNYIMGVWAFFGWATSSTTCVLLAISRLIDFWSPRTGRLLYKGKKTYFWFLIPFLYSLHIIFIAGTCVFNSNTYSFAFDPFYGTPERNGTLDVEHYPHVTLAIHNLAVPAILIIVYILLCIVLAAQTKGLRDIQSSNLSKVQRNIMLQAMIICTVTLVGSLLYDYSSFFPVGMLYTVGSQMGLLSVHGVPGVTYLLFNNTIRTEVKALFCRNSMKVLSSNAAPGQFPQTGQVASLSTQNY
uniref:G protein-coupled receptor n=1 Tax=Panagrellus redivivus TaxID=6233 RepID=A0A7E4UR65_PANRE